MNQNIVIIKRPVLVNAHQNFKMELESEAISKDSQIQKEEYKCADPGPRSRYTAPSSHKQLLLHFFTNRPLIFSFAV